MSVGQKRTAAGEKGATPTSEEAGSDNTEATSPSGSARTRSGGRSGQPIQYKLPPHLAQERKPDLAPTGLRRQPVPSPVQKPTDPSAGRTGRPEKSRQADPSEEQDDEIDYTPLVAGSFRVAILMCVTQIVAALLIANFLGGIIRFAFWFDVIPYLQIWTDGTSFVTIVTWSTTAAIAVTCLGVLHALVRRRDEPLLVDGWASGLPMALFLLLLQLFHEHRQPYDVIDTWVAVQAAAALLATTVIFFGFRPGGGAEGSTSSGKSESTKNKTTKVAET